MAVLDPNGSLTDFWLLGSNSAATATLLKPDDDCELTVVASRTSAWATSPSPPPRGSTA
jgi:hypothetical protein